METSKLDIYEKVTNQIVAAIEAGAGNFRMPWHAVAGESPLPVNAVSKRGYRGINVLALWAAARSKGYASNVWATYRQWKELDAQVRKNEKSSLVVLWKFPEREQVDEAPDKEDGPRKGRGVLARGYFVFNSEQVEGYAPPALEELDPALRMETVEKFFAALDADIRFGGPAAYYDSAGDFVQMPEYRHFRDASGFYATLGHELCHLSGAPHRLNRNLASRYGTAGYALEELVAELGAAFLCAALGISNEPRPDHAAYIGKWLEALRGDKRAVFTAAAKAQAAVDWMHERQPAGELVGNVA